MYVDVSLTRLSARLSISRAALARQQCTFSECQQLPALSPALRSADVHDSARDLTDGLACLLAADGPCGGQRSSEQGAVCAG